MSSQVAKITEPALFIETFYHRTDALTDTWTVADGSFSGFSEKDVVVTEAPAELLYNGTNLNELKRRNFTDDANFVIVFRFFGRQNLKCSIRGRRQDSSNFISFSVDFENGTTSLSKTVAGVETILDSSTHTFDYEEIKYYSLELWMFEEFLYGKINKDTVVSAVDAAFREEPGFSIFVPEIDETDPIRFNVIAVHEPIEQDDPQLEGDPSNLHVVFRKNLEEIVERPTEKTWESYTKAFKMWSKFKDQGYKDPSWGLLGYPIEPPRTEFWFEE